MRSRQREASNANRRTNEPTGGRERVVALQREPTELKKRENTRGYVLVRPWLAAYTGRKQKRVWSKRKILLRCEPEAGHVPFRSVHALCFGVIVQTRKVVEYLRLEQERFLC